MAIVPLYLNFTGSPPVHQISGRGGGTRTPIPGFGDRSPSRWTTPLKPKPSLQQSVPKLLHFLVAGMFAARIAKLLRLHAFGVLLLVLRRRVVAVLAIRTLQRDDFSHDLIPFPQLWQCAELLTR